MAIRNVLAAILVLTSGIGASFAIGSSGYRCIGLSEKRFAVYAAAQNSRFSFTQLPTYPITQFVLFQRNRTVNPTSEALQQAESLLQSQKYAEAEAQLKPLTSSQADNPQVWFDLGFAESHLGKTPEAIAAYKEAVHLGPTWFEANLNLGLAQAKAGNRAEATVALRAATGLKPATDPVRQLSNAWLSLAQVLEESDRGEALSAYQKALEFNPSSSEAAVGAGRLFEAQSDTAAAEKQYLTASGLGDSTGMERLVSLYIKQKRFAEAESWLRKYVAANPQNGVAQVQLGRILAAEGKTQEAIEALQAVNSPSADPSVRRELASLYLENKQYESAANILQDLVQKTPNDGELHCDLGSALLHQHKYPEAETELMKGLNLNSHLDDAYWELAFAAQQNNHYELAIRVLDARAKRLPETASTYWIRAVSYDGLGAFKPAAQNYKLFLQADGGKLPDEEFKARHRLKAIEKH